MEVVGVEWRGRERERERKKKKKNERETERERQTHRERHRDRHTHRERHREKELFFLLRERVRESLVETPRPHILGQLYQLLGHGARWLCMYALIYTDKPILFFVNIFMASVATINEQL